MIVTPPDFRVSRCRWNAAVHRKQVAEAIRWFYRIYELSYFPKALAHGLRLLKIRV